ncbi:hypothetical protein M404DRAFT_33190 [Pisolithus tinctorius Marx 270]|uniref:Uncharacterized protein n=1 Tax=Pisolithus tinctorius Marx 270 TaxID=870435 RepID=A0A0C3NMD5_PISTI|nr:hypothetical protein M404DRAFT_33190 [Pisolithus tinctorius Marx 270]
MFCAICNHDNHRLHKEKVKEYDKAIQEVKKSHWRDWLEEVYKARLPTSVTPQGTY